MLYLNFWVIVPAINALYLTLTSVVFELELEDIPSIIDIYLTLTSVVFEWHY